MRTLALAVLALISSGALAQTCTPTLRGYQSGPVDLSPAVLSSVAALMAFDDGSGPALYAAGLFAVPPTPGLTPISCNVARYRGGEWAPMSTGLPQTTSQAIRTLARADLSGSGGPGLSLYAGGDNASIYRWTGSQWTSPGSIGGTCYSLQPYSDGTGPVLLAGSSNGVFAWRGSGPWSIYEGLGNSGAVYALRIVDDGSGPALFAMGAFHDQARGLNCIAKLVNGAWAPYPINLTSIQSFSDLTSYDDGVHGAELYVAGNFNAVYPNAGVARRRNGAWGVAGVPLSPDVSALGPTFFKVDEGLYVGGVFSVEGVPAGLARLTPSGWRAAAYLSRSASSPSYPSGAVRAAARFDDGSGMKTYFGGIFSGFRTDSSEQTPLTPAFGLIRSGADGLEVVAQGLGDDLSQESETRYRCSLSVVDLGQGPRLFAGGHFARAGGRFARCAAMFDGAAWTPLSLPASGRSDQLTQFGVVAPIAGQQRLVSHILDYSAPGPVGYWDGSQWVHMAVQPPVGYIFAMAVYNGAIYVLGTPGLYRYDGTGWVQELPGSPGGSAMVVGDIGRGGRLYVASSGPLGQGLYEHDGVNYTRLGGYFSSYGCALAIHDDGGGPMIYVAASGIPGFIGRLENNTFVPIVPGGFGFTGPTPLAMASFHDGRSPALYIAGQLLTAGGMPSNGLARWHAGVVTSPTPYVPQANVQGLWRTSLAVYGNRLYIAGDFYNIGGVAADHLAYIDACPRTCTADFNYDGDVATDADIEAFFACLAGNCCANCASADFNGDGDVGNDADIESFFRVLAGGPC
jgi:hypothetical protein